MIPTEYRGLPALSIRQPWAHLIVNGPKRFENREWPSHYAPRNFRGRFLIHAASGCTYREYELAVRFAVECGVDAATIPAWKDLPKGGIVGAATVAGWCDAFMGVVDDEWSVGPGLILKEVVPLPFTPCRGFLGFFKPKFDGVPI